MKLKSLGLVLFCAVSLFDLQACAQTLPVPETLWRLVAQEDTDGDRRITVHDQITPFEIRGTNGAAVGIVANVYPLSVLLQELKRADDEHHATVAIEALKLNESAADRTHRLIKEYYWDALTRRIDAAHIDQVVHDPKTASKYDYIYVPGADATAVRYFQRAGKKSGGARAGAGVKGGFAAATGKDHGRICARLGRRARNPEPETGPRRAGQGCWRRPICGARRAFQ